MKTQEEYIKELEEETINNKVIQKLIVYLKEKGWDDTKILDLISYLTKD